MTGINIIIKLIIVIAVIVTSLISPCYPIISDRRLCYDPQCSEPVSMAKTMITYPSNDPGILSFDRNIEVLVFSKGAGNRKDLWGVEINGRRGYVPSNLLTEKKVYHRKLIHEVPTEVNTKASNNDSRNKETAKQDNVPNAPANLADAPDAVKKDVVEEANGIAKHKLPGSVPVLDQVSPSYEIHDGTTLPYAGNDEPSEPSYATQVPRGVGDLGEQPILSIHPNIASTAALKALVEPPSIAETAEDAGKYPEAAGGLKEEAPGGKIADEGIDATSTELPGEAAPEAAASADGALNEESEEPDDSPMELEDGIKGVEIAAETTVPEAPGSQEIAEETVDLRESSSESTDDEEDDFEQESDSQVVDAPAEKIDAITEPTPIEKEALPVETPTEATAPELPEKNTGSGENIAEEASLEMNNSEKNTSEEANAEDHFEAAIGGNVTGHDLAVDKAEGNSSANLAPKEEPTEANSTSTVQEALPEVEGFGAESEDTKSEQPVETKTEDALPGNLNIMNPLFNRLSKLPALVKKVVDDAISGEASNDSPKPAEEPAAEESTAEPEATSSGEGISEIKESSSLPGDFTTYVDDGNNYRNETDNADPAAGVPEVETAPSPEMETAPSPKVETATSPEVETATSPEVETATSPEVVKTDDRETFASSYNYSLDNKTSTNDSTADSVETQTKQEFTSESPVQPGISKVDEFTGFRQDNVAMVDTSSFNGFPANRNLLNVGSNLQPETVAESSVETATAFGTSLVDQSVDSKTEETPEVSEKEAPAETASREDFTENVESATEDTVTVDEVTRNDDDEENHGFLHEEDESTEEDFTSSIKIGRNFWETFSYVVLTAFTTLLFSLGYYYIENTRRDGQLIAKINKLEKELLVSSKECTVLDDTLKSTKSKLDSIEDESFGSNEMVLSLKADLEASKAAKSELEDQVAMLEKELESATEAGLELERMLREILSTNNEDNPLAQSVEDLQTRLNAQQAANEALTNALNLKAQENENLSSDLAAMTQKCEQLEVEVTRVTEELKHQNTIKSNMEQTMLDKIEQLEQQVKDMSAERTIIRKQLKGKEIEMKDLLEVVNQMNTNNLDFDKLYNVSRVKAEASQLLEERDDLKMRLSDVEGAHQLLEDHVKLINEEVSSLRDQCKFAEKAKRDAETRVEVLSNFFKEKEAQRQKEEAVWLQKQGEVSSTVERLHTMQNEIHNYKQQIEMLKREILDQEREYKNQIASLETKSHEQWMIARQHERRLEESKAEAGQLRNRLTLIEKNLNETDPEAKLHRLEANGETATSPQLFIGAEASSSPIMFTGSSGVPLPPPPSYLYGPPVPPFMPPPPHASSGIPPYEVGQRPPPLGGRLSSPPPLHGTGSSRYDSPRSPPPPLSPSMLPPFGPPHRAYPSPFPNDRIHPPPPPRHSSMLPPPLGTSSHNWGDDTLPPLRNSGFRPHQQHHRDQQRARNHKGLLNSTGLNLRQHFRYSPAKRSLHSSGESLDKKV